MPAARPHADLLESGDPLCHPALVYDSSDDFLATTVPFVRGGLAAGERVLAVTSARNITGLTGALAGDAEGVDFHPADGWLTTPWRALVDYRRYIDRHAAGGRRVRVIGEPFAPRRTEPEALEWTRYESLLNVAFAGLPLTILCPYDASALDPRIVAHARCTHPDLLDQDGTLVRSADYTETRAFSAALDATALAPPREPLVERTLLGSPGDLRRFVHEQAQRAGLPAGRADDVTLAAHELSVNAREHGGGRAVVRTWTADGEFLCEVADEGGGMRDVLAGTVEPEPTQPSGRGLWLSRQLCDLVQVRSGTTGTVVRLHMALA